MAADDDAQLTPEQIRVLADAITRVQKRRRIMLAGYFLALVVMIVGLPTSLYVVGSAG